MWATARGWPRGSHPGTMIHEAIPWRRAAVSGDEVRGNEVPTTILEIAWKMLWTRGSPYYLPNLILNGGSGDGHTVPPLGSRSIPDLGPFALFDKKPWGTVAVSLDHSSLSGLDTIQDQGFTYDSATSAFTAKVGFSQVALAGRYSVTGSGLVGCAVAGVTGLLGLFPTERSLVAEDGDEFDDEHIELAQQYRSQLVQSPSGLELVSNYYDNNDAMNEIVRGDTYFHTVFPTLQTDGKTSKDYASQTTLAARSPDDPNQTVGNPSYRLHAFKMQLAFAKSAQSLYEQTGDTKYTDAGNAKNTFNAQVDNSGIPGATTVGNVMATVRSITLERLEGITAQDQTPLTAEYEAVAREIDEDYDRWREAGNVDRPFSALASDVAASLGDGTFHDRFGVPSFTLNGTVTVTGQVPDVKLTVNLTSASADLPQIDISLSTSHPDTLYDEVVKALGKAQFVKDLMRRKLNDELSSQQVVGWLSDRINDALTKALG